MFLPQTRFFWTKEERREMKDKRLHPGPWLPLTGELSPQATEGENSQPVGSEHPASP